MSKVERAIPVQTRVDCVHLANLDKWMKMQGVKLHSKSAIVSMALDLLVEFLREQGHEIDFITDVIQALKYLEEIGLSQPSLSRRSASKTLTMKGFQNLREEGESPELYAPSRHKELHNRPQRTYDNKKQTKKLSQQIRKLTDEELEKKERELERKEREHLSSWDDVKIDHKLNDLD